MKDGGSVGRPATLAAHTRIVRVGVAIQAVERATRLALELPTLGLNVPLLEVHMAVLEVQHPHHTVAAEVRVGPEHWRILRIRHALIPVAVELGGQRPLDH